MTDYGHDLLFGSFLTPTNAEPQQAVLLARLSEELGLDLATFQDHPYQPAFLDTWTLMSYVAAADQHDPAVRQRHQSARCGHRRCSLAASPASTCSAVAGSSSGWAPERSGTRSRRWAAAGSRRAKACRRCEEAIEVIRAGLGHRPARRCPCRRRVLPGARCQAWSSAGARRRDLAGRLQTADAARSPGELADGWLPSLGPIDVPAISAPANERIDEAADAAGREPTAIRRLLNIGGEFSETSSGMLQGPVGQWVDQLTELALEDGVSGFILMQRRARELSGTPPRSPPRCASRSRPPAPRSIDRPPTKASRSRRDRSTEPARVARGSFSVIPTPDDGTRLSEQTVWDESTRPTGPQHDPERTYTDHEQSTGRHLIDVHNHLREELAQIRDLIEQVAAGGIDAGAARSHINTMTMRQNKWTLGTYCESYCRVVTTHHTIEDQTMLPHLRQADPRLAPVVDRLQAEHLVIHDVLERVDRALVAFVGAAGRHAGAASRPSTCSATPCCRTCRTRSASWSSRLLGCRSTDPRT